MLCDGRHSERPPSDSLTDSLDSLPHPGQLAARRCCGVGVARSLDLGSARMSRSLRTQHVCEPVGQRRSGCGRTGVGSNTLPPPPVPLPRFRQFDSFPTVPTVSSKIAKSPILDSGFLKTRQLYRKSVRSVLGAIANTRTPWSRHSRPPTHLLGKIKFVALSFETVGTVGTVGETVGSSNCRKSGSDQRDRWG